MLQRLLLALVCGAIFTLQACKSEDCTAEPAAQVAADLQAYKANTLGDKLKKTASGLEYIVHEQGTGTQIQDQEFVLTHYYGVLKSDGTEFDNSYSDCGEGAWFKVGTLVAGFNEGMKLLNHGGKATLFIPYNLGYGENSTGSIPSKSDLVFYIELK